MKSMCRDINLLESKSTSSFWNISRHDTSQTEKTVQHMSWWMYHFLQPSENHYAVHYLLLSRTELVV